MVVALLLAIFRNRSVGFVFQFHYLLPEFTALQNAAMPGFINRLGRDEAMERAREVLKQPPTLDDEPR